MVKQVVAVFMTHASLFGIKGDSGHDEMHMGVIVQSAVMGMQYGHCPCAAAQLIVILAKGVDCFPRAACDQVIHYALMLTRQCAKLGGQGEGEHEVVAGDGFLQLLVYPTL